jgi:tetratricopeptide (TPR) repeat protein/TolB-like protein
MKRVLSIITLSLFILIFTVNQLPAKQMNILVYPFKNSGSKRYSWISLGMTDTVITDLNKIKDIHVISENDRKNAIREIELGQSGLISEESAVRVGKITGANLIFTGSYLVVGERIRVTAKLIMVDTGGVIKTMKVDGTVSNIFELQDKVVISLMTEKDKIVITGITPARFDEEDEKIIKEKVKPKSGAYELYSRALEIHEKNPKKALKLYMRALQKDNRYLDAVNGIIDIHTTMNEFKKALYYASKAKSLLKQLGMENTGVHAELNSNVGRIYLTKGEYDKALQQYFKAQDIMNGLGLQGKEQYAGIMRNIGQVYWIKGDYDKALDYYFKAQAIREGLGLETTGSYAILMNNIGLIYKTKGDCDKALDYYTKALRIRDTLGLQSTGEYAIIMNNIALVYETRGEYDKALQHYFKAQEIRNKLGMQNTDAYANLMNNIGVTYWGKGEYDKSLYYYLKSQDISKRLRLQNTDVYAALMQNIGSVYSKKGAYDKALQYYFRSQKICKKLGLQKTINYAFLLSNISAIYYMKLRKPCKGIAYQKECVEILESHSHSDAILYRAILEKQQRDCKKQ